MDETDYLIPASMGAYYMIMNVRTGAVLDISKEDDMSVVQRNAKNEDSQLVQHHTHYRSYLFC